MKEYVVNNFKAINYQFTVGQLSTCIDLEGCSLKTMMFEKYPSISPYTYCANNPMKYVDPTGMEVGDPGDPPPVCKSNYPSQYNKTQPQIIIPYAPGQQPQNSSGSTTSTGSSGNTSSYSSKTESTSKETAMPVNPLVTASVNRTKTIGEAKLLNVDSKETTTVSSNSLPTLTNTKDYQIKSPLIGASVYGGGGSDGSIIGGFSMSYGLLQLGISATGSPDIINSSINVNVDINYKKNKSVGISFGIKPVTIVSVAANSLLRRFMPVIQSQPVNPNSTMVY